MGIHCEGCLTNFLDMVFLIEHFLNVRKSLLNKNTNQVELGSRGLLMLNVF